MPQINYWINNHKLPAIMQYAARAYAPKKYDKDPWRVDQIKLAMTWIQTAVVEGTTCAESCDEAFGKLAGGKKFSELWADQSIHISFLTTPDPKTYGQAKMWGKDLAIAYGSFRHGWKMVAATIIHEMAHLNGAPDNTKEAEATLLHCGLKSKHRKEIIGYLQAIPNNAIQFA
jgi:hypothetical protein